MSTTFRMTMYTPYGVSVGADLITEYYDESQDDTHCQTFLGRAISPCELSARFSPADAACFELLRQTCVTALWRSVERLPSQADRTRDHVARDNELVADFFADSGAAATMFEAASA